MLVVINLKQKENMIFIAFSTIMSHKLDYFLLKLILRQLSSLPHSRFIILSEIELNERVIDTCVALLIITDYKSQKLFLKLRLIDQNAQQLFRPQFVLRHFPFLKLRWLLVLNIMINNKSRYFLDQLIHMRSPLNIFRVLNLMILQFTRVN